MHLASFVLHAAWLRRGRPVREYGEPSVAITVACLSAALAHMSGQSRHVTCPLLCARQTTAQHCPFAGYFESVHNFHRRQLAPDELRLVSSEPGRAGRSGGELSGQGEQG